MSHEIETLGFMSGLVLRVTTTAWSGEVVRDSDEALRKCPTCGSDTAADLGYRNFEWINPFLPGREGAMDGDFILEKKGHILMLETKPAGAYLPLGQRITLRAFVKKGVWVLVVWDLGDDELEMGRMDERGEVPLVKRGTKQDLVDYILNWREAAVNGEL